MQKRKLWFSVVYAAFVMNGSLVSADLSTATTDSSSTVEGNARRDNDIVLPVSNLKSESIDLSQQKVSAKNKLLLSLGVLMLVFGPGLIGFATPLAIAFGVFCCFIGIILSSIGGIGVRKDYALVSAVSKASVVTGKNACAGVYTDQTTPPAGGSMSPKLLQESDASVKTEDSASKAISEESQDTHEVTGDHTTPQNIIEPLQGEVIKVDDGAQGNVAVPVQVQLDESKKHGQTQNGGDHSRRGPRMVIPIMLSQPKRNDMDKNASESKSGVDNDDDKNLDAGQMAGDNVQEGEIVDHSATQIEESSCEVPNAQELMREIACALCENVHSSESAVGHSATNVGHSATENEQKKLLNRLTTSGDTQQAKKAMSELIHDLSQSAPKYKPWLQMVLNILRNPQHRLYDLYEKLRSIWGQTPSSGHTILSLAISNQDLCLVQGIVEALGQECLSVKCSLKGQEYHVLELLCRNMHDRRSYNKEALISEKCILAYLLMNMDREKNVDLINRLIALYSSEQQLDTELHKQNAIYIRKVLSIFKDETDHMGWIGMILAAVCEHLSTSSAKNTAALATILKLLNKSDQQHIAYVEALCQKYAESEHNKDICKILNDFLSHNINSQSVTRPKKRNG